MNAIIITKKRSSFYYNRRIVDIKSNDLYTAVGSTAVQKYRGTVTQYFLSTVIGNDDTFSKSTVFSTVDTVLTILHDISVTFFLNIL